MQKAYGLNKAISIYFSLKKMAILDVIFPQKNPFVQVAVPFFGHKVVNFCHKKNKK
jgi:hypothetical protein